MKKDLALFNQIVNKILKAEEETPVVTPIHPKQMHERFDLALSNDPMDDNKFIETLEDIILNTPRTASNHFFNQLTGGRNSRATLGELLAVMLNNTMATYKAAGPQVGVEQVIIKEICSIIGYNENASGTMSPGGSMSILMSMLMARDYFNKDIRNQGVKEKITLYTSVESHYSIPKNASFIGVGRDNVRYIKTNDKGQMLACDLEEQIKKDIEAGNKPFYVNATIGTTVLSVIDSVDEIADVCEKYNVWLHADGAYLGSIIFSEKYSKLAKGLNRTHSFSINPHKMLNTPISTSIIVTNHNECLVNTFSNEAEYLYQTSSDEHNLGKISMQCGRRNDALKFWCLWKSVGTKGLAKIVDH
jgi:sulfinoalanine decarboxylase